MKRLLIVILAGCLFWPAAAQPAERVFLATDRDWYAAGETVWLSAFCVTGEPRLSQASSIAYVELVGADGPAVTAKVALSRGRGAGALELPRTLPTGNYRLYGYTALTGDACAVSRILSVYNTLSTARVEGGVSVGEAPESPVRASSSLLQAAQLPSGELRITARTSATLSVSVVRNEPLPSYGSPAVWGAFSDVTDSVVPEYDGEIVTLHLSGADGQPLPSRRVFVSRPGHPGDVYSTTLQPDGTARFYTCNFFGPGDLVVSLEKGAPAFKAELEQPFRGLAAGELPPLVLSPALSDAINRLGVRMQLTAAFDADTLYSRLPVRELPFISEEGVLYRLDDYTRFSTLQEVFTEYLSDIRVRGRGESLELQVRCRDRARNTLSFRDQPSLMLVDGVPVLDHSLVYQLEPALVKAIEVYRYGVGLGSVFSGVANFITFKGDMGGIRFGDNVRILSYEGPAYPMSFGPSSSDLHPQERETLLWQPLVDLSAGESLVLRGR